MRGFAVALAIFAAAPAVAADWWLVDGEPGGSSALFADAESIRASAGGVQVAVMRIGKGEPAGDTRIASVGCDAASGDKIQAFACGTRDTRDATAMMLGDMAPAAMAEILFGLGSPAVSYASR